MDVNTSNFEDSPNVPQGIWMEEGEEEDSAAYQQKLATLKMAKKEAARTKDEEAWLKAEIGVKIRMARLEGAESTCKEGQGGMLRPMPDSLSYQQQYAENYGMNEDLYAQVSCHVENIMAYRSYVQQRIT